MITLYTFSMCSTVGGLVIANKRESAVRTNCNTSSVKMF
jgi:hypothetical protein